MRLHLALLFTVAVGMANAQLAVSSKKIDFGTKQTGTVDSLKVTFTSASTPLSVTLKLSDPVFFLKESTVTATSVGKDVWVYFSPVHNIAHHSWILIRASGESTQGAIELTGTGTYNEPYYAATQNLSEEALKTALKTITSTGHISLGYNTARDKMFMEIDNKKVNGQGATVNTLECIYTGRLATGYTSRSDAQTNDNFNTEHTWPQSLFNQNNPMVCDLNHLFPTDETANSTRSNYPFGPIATPTWSVGGSKFASNVGEFEPRDEQKGRTARAMLYFATRYKDDAVTLSFITTQEIILRQWSKQFPPNAVDRKRNDDVKAAQGNRNPYIDHPEFLERIHSLSGVSAAPPSSRLVLFTDTLHIRNSSYDLQSDSVIRYKLLVHNEGNQSIAISSATFANTDTLMVERFPATLAAGSMDTIVVAANVHSTTSAMMRLLYDSLKVTSNSTANPSVVIPFSQSLTRQSHVGLAETMSASTFQLFPNPSNSHFAISSQDVLPFDIYVTNLQGEIMLEQKGNLAETTINPGHLAAGFYTVRIESTKGAIVKKLALIH